MTRFEVIKAITVAEKFAELVYDLVNHTGGKAQLAELLKKELSEEELQTLTSITQSDYPLSLLHALEINNGIILDGKHLNGVREFRYEQKEGEQIGTLTLKMDVRILKNQECAELTSAGCKQKSRRLKGEIF